MRQYLRVILRILISIILFFTILVPLLLFILFRIPSVQNFAINKVSATLSDKIHSKVEIQNMDYSFPNGFKLKKIYVEDRNKDTLFYSQELSVHLNVLKLLNKKVQISDLDLVNTKIDLYRNSGDKNFNFTFIADAFNNSADTSSAWEFDLKDFSLNTFRLSYKDIPGGITLNSSIKTLSVDFKSLGLDQQQLRIKHVNADQLFLSINNSLKETENAPVNSNEPWKCFIKDLSLKSSHLIFNDFTQEPTVSLVDFNRLNVHSINTHIEDIIIDDSIEFDIQEFSGKEQSGFVLNNLEGDFIIKPDELLVEKFKFETSNSFIKDPLALKIPIGENANMYELTAKGNLKNGSVAFQDLNYFIPGLDTIPIIKDKKLAISGNISGKLNNFLLKDFKLNLDDHNFIEGNIGAKGLSNIPNTYWDMKIKKLEIDSSLLAYINNFSDSLINVKSLEKLNLSGSLIGKLSKAKVDIDVKSENGVATAKGELNLDNQFNFKGFIGDASVSDLNLKKLFPSLDQFGKVTLRTYIDSYNNKFVNIDAKITELNFNNYTYHDIQLYGDKEGNKLYLKGKIRDKNISSQFNLFTDLKNDFFKMDGQIETIDLKALNILPSPSILESNFKAEVKGRNIDSMEGYIQLSDVLLSNEKEDFILDSLVVSSVIKDSFRQISITAPNMEAVVKGNFIPSEFPNIYEIIAARHYSLTTTDSLYEKLKTEHFDISVKAGDVSKPISFFVPEIELLDGLNGKGEFNRIEKSFTFYLTTAELKALNYQCDKAYLKTKSVNENDLEFHVGASKIHQGTSIAFDQPSLHGILSNDSLKFNFKVFDQNAPTRLSLDGIALIGNDRYKLHFPSSQIVVNNKEWRLNSSNEILFGENYLEVNALELTVEHQKISVSSDQSSGANNLDVFFSNVELKGLTEIAGMSNYKASGLINGKLEIKDLFSRMSFNSGFKIESFVLSNQKLGVLTFDAVKNSFNDFVEIRIGVQNDSAKAKLSGVYYLAEEDKVDFDISISNFPIKALESFTKDVFNHLRGGISGEFKLTGLSSNPVLTGILQLVGRNEIGLTFTNTKYRIKDEKIYFRTNKIEMDRFTILDSLNNKAVINGYIKHTTFKDLQIHLDFDSDKFQLVNSRANPNKLFYGKLFTKIHADVDGPLKDLKIKFDIKTLKSTNFSISVVQSQLNSQTPLYIRFHPIESVINSDSTGLYKLALSDSTDVDVDKINFDASGRIVVTKDAKLNMIVDPVNGDKVSAVGEAELEVDFDSFNNMNIEGSFVIDTGSYNFSFEKLVKRDFAIEKGSVITWNGTPEEAFVDITGKYETKASRYALVTGQADFMSQAQQDAARRRLPVEVYLYFKGQIMNPNITFDIKIPEGGDPLNGNIVVQELNEIKKDPGELNKQVFSLILTNRFTGRESNPSITPNNNLAFSKVNQSVSNMLTNYLSSFGNDFIPGFDVNINFESLDQSYGSFAQNAKLMVSKDISSRISVSAGGNMNINSNYSSGQFAGDYSVHYRLNSSGSVNMKFFRTSVQNIYSSSIYTNQGFSMNFQRNFNKWRYVFGTPDDKK